MVNILRGTNPHNASSVDPDLGPVRLYFVGVEFVKHMLTDSADGRKKARKPPYYITVKDQEYLLPDLGGYMTVNARIVDRLVDNSRWSGQPVLQAGDEAAALAERIRTQLDKANGDVFQLDYTKLQVDAASRILTTEALRKMLEEREAEEGASAQAVKSTKKSTKQEET